MGAKEKVILEDTDLVFDKNKKLLYRGVQNTENSADNIPLESRALITEQQLNYLAKDIREYLEDENYVSYNYPQNAENYQREQAIDNIFGNGILEGKIDDFLGTVYANAQGINVLDEESTWLKQAFSDVAAGKRKIFYLTDKAVYGQYGIPILSEYFTDITDDEVIYRKETYEELYAKNRAGWDTNDIYKNGVKNNTDLREKLKWHFADFYRVGNTDLVWEGNHIQELQNAFGTEAKKNILLNGLYGTQVGGSLPAFCEYLPLPWRTFVPKALGDIEDELEGALLYQPSTGRVYEVQSNSNHVTVNTLLNLKADKSHEGNYRYNSIYAKQVQKAIEDSFGIDDNGTFFIQESNLQKYLYERGMVARDDGDSSNTSFPIDPKINANKPNGLTIFNRYSEFMKKDGSTEEKVLDLVTSNQDGFTTNDLARKIKNGKDAYNYGPIKNNYFSIESKNNKTTYHVYPILRIVENFESYGVYDTEGKSVTTRYQNKIPKTTDFLQNYFNNSGGSSAAIENNKWKGSSLFRPVINEARPRIFYNTASLSRDTYGEVVEHYPKGAMAIHCIPRGTVNNGTIWKFIGNTLKSGGIEYPADKENYQKLFSNGISSEVKLNDFIYNPYSTEIRQISRPAILTENGNGDQTFLTKPVYSYEKAEEDGVKRVVGTYLRGNQITYMQPAPTEYNDGINNIVDYPNFVSYLLEQNSLGARFSYLSDFIEILKNQRQNILSDEQSNTKKVFNTLYLLPQAEKNIILNANNLTQELKSKTRFKQLNFMIPGDFILAIEDNNYNLYQTTSAPYLFDIFKDNINAKILFINYTDYIRQHGYGSKLTISDYVLRDLFITELKNNGKYYHKAGNTYMFDNNGNIIETTQGIIDPYICGNGTFEEWLQELKKAFPDLDVDTILKYTINEEQYISDLKHRLLTNLQCPIVIDAAPVTTLPSMYIIGDEVIDQINSATLIIENNSISEQHLTSELQNKINYFKVLVTDPGYEPEYEAYSDWYNFFNAFTSYTPMVTPNYNDIIIGTDAIYYIVYIDADTTPYAKKIGDFGTSTVTLNQLEQTVQNKIVNSYVKPNSGIPKEHLRSDIQKKLNAPIIHYPADYEEIYYDNEENSYIFNSSDREQSSQQYSQGDLILGPSLNSIFKLENEVSSLYNSTPTFLTKIVDFNDNLFIIEDLGGTTNPSLVNYGCQTSEEKINEFNKAEQCLLNGQNLRIEFTIPDNEVYSLLLDYKLLGGYMTTYNNYKTIYVPFVFEDNFYNLVWKNMDELHEDPYIYISPQLRSQQ